MGAKINAIKEFFGVGAKKAVAEAKKEAPQAATKEVSPKVVKDMQEAEASYGKANIAMQNTGKKKAYVRPETKVVKVEHEENLMAASDGPGRKTNEDPFVGPKDDDESWAKPNDIWSAWDEK